MLRSHLDRFVMVGAVENVEAADLRVGIQERAVADDRLPVAASDGQGLADRLEHMALFAHSTRVHLAHPGAHSFRDGRALFSRELNGSVGIDEQHELHDAPPRATDGLLLLVVLRRAVDRRNPALAPFHEDLVLGLQLEGRLVETSEPNLDERVAGVGRGKDARPAPRAEAATVIARDLAAQLERLDGPVRVHGERTAGLLSAIRAMAPPDVHGLTANAVADRPAETSARAYSGLHARRCYATRAGPAFGKSFPATTPTDDSCAPTGSMSRALLPRDEGVRDDE